MKVVYFTTSSGNVGRFASKITKFETVQIPQSSEEASSLLVAEEFALVIPTYLAGNPNSPNGKNPKVSPPIVKFLNNETNRQYLRGVVGSGNTSYGATFCASARIVAEKCQVPLIHMFEISGTPEDIIDVEEKVERLAKQSN